MKNLNQLIFAMLVCSFSIISCKSDDDSTQEIDCATYDWEYISPNSPDTWSDCFMDCGGTIQSPINITEAVADAALQPLETEYMDVPIDVNNNGKTVQFSYAAGSDLIINGDAYELKQFHFHTGSEHQVEGEQFEMEIHLVHQNAGGFYAVVSLLVQEGQENAFLKTFSDDYPSTEGGEFTSATMVNVQDLLPTNPDYYTYGGSLTTPPCSETVTWFVMKTPITASSAQISDMADILQDNFRPLQPLDGRVILESI